jgi:predicted extracellular nuclease
MKRSLLRLLAFGAALVAVPAAAASPNGVVISELQVRGPAGGNDEFVELLNTSAVPVEISGWRLQGCAGASGAPSTRATVPAGVTLAAGQHYLFANSAGTYAAIADTTYGTGISDDGGARMVDLASVYVDGVANQDSTAVDQCREGTGVSFPTTNGDRAFERKDEGRQDTDSNVDDFEGPKAGNPQPFGAPPEPPPATPAEIHEIQGAAHRSPLVGERVETTGIVVAARSSSFYLQDPTPDADDATSDAVLVFGATAPVGAAVTVRGAVQEFRPGNDADNLTTTELGSPGLLVTVTSSGNALPAVTVVGVDRIPPLTVIEDDVSGDTETTGVFDPASDGLDFWESLEGMRISVADAVAVGPRNSFGEIPVTVDGLAGLRTARGGVLARPVDFNPERILLDDTLVPTPPVNVGDRFTADPVGVLDYSFANFKLFVTETPVPVDGGLARETTEPAERKELAVATFNVENLDPGDGPAKFEELADLIVHNLQAPDLLALEEVQDDDGPANTPTTDASLTLATLVAAIESQGGPTYQWRQINPQDDQDGGEPGGNIRVAFLFRTDRGLEFVDRPGGDATTPTAVTGSKKNTRLTLSPGRIDPLNPAWASSRKPLAGEFRYRHETLFVIANHFNSKGGDQPLFGRFQPPERSSEVQRHAQAAVVNGFVDQILARDRKAKVIVLGDLNDFEFSETLDIVEGGVLDNLIESLPVSERYTYVFEGNSQTLDHILVSDELSRHDRFEYDVVHVNAEFAVQASDHDPQVARLDIR